MGHSDRAGDANLFSLSLESIPLLRVLLQMLVSSIYRSMPLLPLLRVVCHSLHSLLQCATHTVMLPAAMVTCVVTHIAMITGVCLLGTAVSRATASKACPGKD